VLPEGRVVLGGRDKLVHCLDAATGASQWSFATRARVDSSPGVAGGRVDVGSSDGQQPCASPCFNLPVWEC
jgi:outer membrane protein assembly factor BamB